MKQSPSIEDNTGLHSLPAVELLSKSDLNLEAKVRTLEAISKLDAATVCGGCNSGWYNYGGELGVFGGNWFGDALCNMNGFCARSGRRAKHNRQCRQKTKVVNMRPECIFQQFRGTVAVHQELPCVIYCTSGKNPGDEVHKKCGDAKEGWKGVGCTKDSFLTEGTGFGKKCGMTSQDFAKGVEGNPCGGCIEKPTELLAGGCVKCKCNVGTDTSHDDDDQNCGYGEYSCKAGVCPKGSHVETRTANGLLICVKIH